MGRDRICLGLLAVSAVLLFTSLGDGLLWQDEAETAILARHVLEFGYPRASDGFSVLEAGPFASGPGEAWIYSPWLPFYVLAGFFRVFGESTWVARFPFALFGWVSIWLTWKLARRLTQNLRIHRLSIAWMSFSVPFLLQMRQCRYYGMAVALLLAVILAYLSWIKRSQVKQAGLLVLALIALFYTNFGLIPPLAAAMIVHQWRWGTKASRRLSWAIGLAVAVATVPWILFSYSPQFMGSPTWERLEDHLEFYVRVTNKYLAPLAAMVLATLAMRFWGGRLPASGWRKVAASKRAFLILTVVFNFFFLLVPYQRHLRYIIPMLPLIAIAVAWWLSWVIAWRGRFGWTFAALAVFTMTLQSWPPRVPLQPFMVELAEDYRGPMEGVVEYLNAHAKAGETAKIPYDDRTLLFYTPLRVERPTRFADETFPDWIILRGSWLPSGFLKSDYFRRIEERYERIELSAPDIHWQNREDPGSHHFRSVTEAPPVVLYRKRETNS